MWLGVYTKWLMYATVAGFFTFIQVGAPCAPAVDVSIRLPVTRTLQISATTEGSDDYSVALVPMFAAFLSVWSTLFLENWKRQQVRQGVAFGVASLTAAATDSQSNGVGRDRF